MQFYVLCNSCGQGFTYTDDDMRKNAGNAAMNLLSSVGQIAGAVSGNWGGAIANKMNEKKLKDFSRCPHCGSHDLKHVSQEEFQRSQKKLAGGGVAISINANASVEALIKRTKLLMEDHEWDTAEAYCRQILDREPENSEVYFLLALIENKAESPEALSSRKADLRTSRHYKNIVRFGDEALIEKVNALNAAYDSRLLAEKSLQEERQREQERLKRQEKEKAQEQKYLSAVKKAEAEDISTLRQALSDFSSLGLSYKDVEKYAEDCKRKIADLEAASAKKTKKILSIAIPAVILCVAALLLITRVLIPGSKYSHAEALLEEGDAYGAAVAFYENKAYKDSWERCFALWGGLTQRETLSCSDERTVGLKTDGTVVAVGYEGNGWGNVSDWTNIAAISAGRVHTVGLKADGTVVIVRYVINGGGDVSDWADIVAISTGDNHTVGLKADGTVVAVGDNAAEQYEVSNWTGIVAISAGRAHTVGLKADGTVVAVGYNGFGQCNVRGWTDIVAISAGDDHTVGLKTDGTVVAVGDDIFGQCDVSGWTDIVAVSAGDDYTVGLKADGTVVSVGANNEGQRDVSGWNNIKLPD